MVFTAYQWNCAGCTQGLGKDVSFSIDIATASTTSSPTQPTLPPTLMPTFPLIAQTSRPTRSPASGNWYPQSFSMPIHEVLAMVSDLCM
jgi:hypothetical protein